MGKDIIHFKWNGEGCILLAPLNIKKCNKNVYSINYTHLLHFFYYKKIVFFIPKVWLGAHEKCHAGRSALV